MRVLLLTDADVFAGTERHMLDLGLALGPAGVDATIGCPGDGALAERARAAGVRVIPIPKTGAVDWRAARRIAAAIRAGDIDLVHAHNGRTALVGAMSTAWAGRGSLVATQHFLQPSRLGRRGLKAVASRVMHRWVERRVDRFVATSQAVRERMLARGDCAEAKIALVPNGMVPPEPRDAATVRRVRAEFGAGPDTPLVVCASRLQAEKNVVGLVEAMARVHATRSDAVCVIAGTGDEEPAIRCRIAELKLDDHVHLAGFRSDVLDVIAAGDVFVLPSHAEPFGLVLLEAMSLGKPVVATAAGGPLEVVEEGRTGLLVKPGDSGAMASAISQLICDPQRRDAMGRAGRERFLKCFTAEQMGCHMANMYKNLVRPKHDGQKIRKSVEL